MDCKEVISGGKTTVRVSWNVALLGDAIIIYTVMGARLVHTNVNEFVEPLMVTQQLPHTLLV